ncbi:hypothetical protein EXIGLDRAFT_127369 [Exidia glandulosa HHB12029]|uniref:Uncharacterized protein n=1 Tax=Exidia glandulosa HHB12029 TaxID=1314781 RepID=A0A165GAA1_EXIGL|nr:hypothetical protein EXIGLDRAFT_127369 [Exidia glandulosa HHB12029]
MPKDNTKENMDSRRISTTTPRTPRTPSGRRRPPPSTPSSSARRIMFMNASEAARVANLRSPGPARVQDPSGSILSSSMGTASAPSSPSPRGRMGTTRFSSASPTRGPRGRLSVAAAPTPIQPDLTTLIAGVAALNVADVRATETSVYPAAHVTVDLMNRFGRMDLGPA